MMEHSLHPLQAAYGRALTPPERLSWVEFAEKHMRLTSRETATPGPLRLWATQRGIIEVINAGEHRFVTIMKAARAGITKAAIVVPAVCIAAIKAANILILVPREEDVRRYALEEVAPAFEESLTLRHITNVTGSGKTTSDTMHVKSFTSGSLLRISALGSAANLRGLSIKVLLMDEIDAARDFALEGDPVAIAIMRNARLPRPYRGCGLDAKAGGDRLHRPAISRR